MCVYFPPQSGQVHNVIPPLLSPGAALNTRSPLEDSRLFGPSPSKVLAATYEQKDF